MTLDQETPRETRDWTKLLWVGIVAMLALMALILWWAGRPEPGTSIVYSKHILIGYDPGNPADRERAFELAARLRERVLAGEDFARLAREYSSDKNSATRGGELPPFRRMDELEPAFAQYVWNGPVGYLSDVIATRFGFHIVLVTDRHISAEDAYNIELERRAAEALERGQADDREPAPSLPANPALEDALR